MTSGPIRLFVGTAASDEDLEAQMVYEYSLRKRTTREVDLTWLRLSRDPASFWYADPDNKLGWRTRKWRTPFTALRWGIPAFLGFEGKALYTDCDMIVMDDIGKLWDQEFEPGRVAMTKRARPIFCTTLIDCAAIRPHMPPVEDMRAGAEEHLEVKAMFRARPELLQAFEGNWNCHDGEDYKRITDPDVRILHYTRIHTQPTHRWAKKRLEKEGKKHWYAKKTYPHPRPEVTKLFDQTYKAALAAGFNLKKYRQPIFGDYRR